MDIGVIMFVLAILYNVFCQVENLEQILVVCATCRVGAKIIRNGWANNFDRGAICSPHIAFTK